MANLYKYTELVKLQTPYAKRLQYLTNRIFGEVGQYLFKIKNSIESFLKFKF